MSETFEHTIEVKFEVGAYLLMADLWWRVLEIDEAAHRALLVTETVVAQTQYHHELTSVTWEKCSLRQWLNRDFLDENFSELEKAAVLESLVINEDHPIYKTPGGKDTRDRIFILSMSEAGRYFKDNRDRAKGMWWWLRTPALYDRNAMLVNFAGMIDRGGDVLLEEGVRPALNIDLESDYFKSLVVKKSECPGNKELPAGNSELPAGNGELSPENGELPERCRISGDENREIWLSVPPMVIKGSVLKSINPVIKQAFTSFEVPAGMTEIGERAFQDARELVEVLIPASVMAIAEYAFQGCKKLEKVLISPESLRRCKSEEIWKVAGLNMAPADFCSVMDACPDAIRSRLEVQIRGWGDIAAARYFEEAGRLEEYAANNHTDGDMDWELFPDQADKGSSDCAGAGLAESDSLDAYASMRAIGREPSSDTATDTELAVKLRKLRIYADFLEGRAIPADKWCRTYLQHPVFAPLAQGLVWQQGMRCFMVVDGSSRAVESMDVAVEDCSKNRVTCGKPSLLEASSCDRLLPLEASNSGKPSLLEASNRGRLVSYDGSPVLLNDEAILPAHPMEMTTDVLAAWIKYMENSRVAPLFEQLSEPLMGKLTLSPHRYRDAEFPLRLLQKRDLDGIGMPIVSRVLFRDCEVDLRLARYRDSDLDHLYMVRDFRFEKFTRTVNHIAALLDRITVRGRLLKDDASAVMWLDDFSQDEIEEMTAAVIAQGNCPNAAAALMTYKDEKFRKADAFADLDIDDDLDW